MTPLEYMAKWLKREVPKTRRKAIDLCYLYYLDQNDKSDLKKGFDGWPGKLKYPAWKKFTLKLQRIEQ